jgi:dimethylargininase
VAVSNLIAITRGVSPAIVRCELTHVPRVPIDPVQAAAQHVEYERALTRMGCSVQRLDTEPDMPDSVFVEDTAVVLDELAVIMRPGAESRRREVPRVAGALADHRRTATIDAPGAIDGGDVLVIGQTIFVGETARTNAAAIDQFREIVSPLGYDVRSVPVQRCLHLKSAATAVDENTLLINRAWLPEEPFTSYDLIEVDPAEPAAANVVRVGQRLLYSAAYPRTRERLEARGCEVTLVDVSEIAKAEGAVTCCSLIFKSGGIPKP